MTYNDKAIRPARIHRPAVATRRRFTADELLAMETAGILHPDERVELIDGDIITMAAKSPRHDDMSNLLDEYLSDHRPQDVRVGQEVTFRLSQHYEPEPDLILFPRSLRVSQVRGPTALLVIEVAVSTLSDDLDVKAPRYAAHGVREYWVVDAKRLVMHIHRNPGPDGYGEVRVAPATEPVTPALIPSLAVRLADLGLEPLNDEAGADEPSESGGGITQSTAGD